MEDEITSYVVIRLASSSLRPEHDDNTMMMMTVHA